MNEDMNSFKNREFICACGKNYLSYAALFTHIKQKHDGKAPGPITRPRSQRKRGRPRKNPNAENELSESESDQPQNGILKGIDINNIQKEQQQQQKTKKSIQLLGSGAFAAFTAYKPEPARCPQKKDGQSSKKNISKKLSCQNIQRKCSTSFNSLQQKQNEQSILNSQKQRVQMVNFCQKLQILNKNELKKIFQMHNQSLQKIQVRGQDLSLLNKLANRLDMHNQVTDFESVSLIGGVCQLLKEVRQCLMGDQQTKIDNSGSHPEQDCHESSNQFDQIMVMAAFVLHNLIRHSHKEISDLENYRLSSLTENLNDFIFEYLPTKIEEYGLQNYELFKDFNPAKFIVFFCNWISLRKTQTLVVNAKVVQIANDVCQKTPQRLSSKPEKEDWSQSHHSSQIDHREGENVCPSISKIDEQ